MSVWRTKWEIRQDERPDANWHPVSACTEQRIERPRAASIFLVRFAFLTGNRAQRCVAQFTGDEHVNDPLRLLVRIHVPFDEHLHVARNRPVFSRGDLLNPIA